MKRFSVEVFFVGVYKVIYLNSHHLLMLLHAYFKPEHKRTHTVNWIQSLSDQRLMESRGVVCPTC